MAKRSFWDADVVLCPDLSSWLHGCVHSFMIFMFLSLCITLIMVGLFKLLDCDPRTLLSLSLYPGISTHGLFYTLLLNVIGINNQMKK